MKSIIILALGLLLLSCSKSSSPIPNTQSGLTVSGVEHKAVEHRSACELDLAEGERTEITFWVKFQQGDKSGAIQSDFIIERMNNELRLIVAGDGGDGIDWISKSGRTISGTQTISDVNPPEECRFEITLKQG